MLFHKCDYECNGHRDKDHVIPGRWEIDGVKYSRCPLVYLTNDIFTAGMYYKMFKSGFMPNQGGWTMQSNKFIQTVTFIDEVIKKWQTTNSK